MGERQNNDKIADHNNEESSTDSVRSMAIWDVLIQSSPKLCEDRENIQEIQVWYEGTERV